MVNHGKNACSENVNTEIFFSLVPIPDNQEYQPGDVLIVLGCILIVWDLFGSTFNMFYELI